jgi:hypothetical protein
MLLINIRVVDLHYAFGLGKRGETKTGVQAMCIEGSEHETAQILQTGMPEDDFYQPFA